MPVRVVDSSALGALLFGEPEAEVVAERLSGAALVAPALLPFELASIALKKIRAEPRSSEAVLESLDLWRRMDIETVAVPEAEVVLLARETGLTVYDTAYLWLHDRLEADDLVTLDARLEAVAEVGCATTHLHGKGWPYHVRGARSM